MTLKAETSNVHVNSRISAQEIRVSEKNRTAKTGCIDENLRVVKINSNVAKVAKSENDANQSLRSDLMKNSFKHCLKVY